jgi:hypothetical protein
MALPPHLVFDGASPQVLVVLEFVGIPPVGRVCDMIMNQVGPPSQNFGEGNSPETMVGSSAADDVRYWGRN